MKKVLALTLEDGQFVSALMAIRDARKKAQEEMDWWVRQRETAEMSEPYDQSWYNVTQNNVIFYDRKVKELDHVSTQMELEWSADRIVWGGRSD